MKFSNEPLALEVIKQWDTLPGGCKIVPEHLETRGLFHPEKPGVEQVENIIINKLIIIVCFIFSDSSFRLIIHPLGLIKIHIKFLKMQRYTVYRREYNVMLMSGLHRREFIGLR
jgi:hypothetical protein